MTYPRQTQLSAELTNAVLALAEGSSLLLSEASPAATDVLRRKLYEWFFQNSLRGVFKIQREAPTRLRVVRRINLRPEIVFPALSTTEEFVCNNLLDCETEEEASVRVRKALTDGQLTFGQVEEVLAEWRKKC